MSTGNKSVIAPNNIDKIYSIDELHQKISPILRQTPIKRLAIFGSYAIESQTPTSDIDFIFELNQDSLAEWDYLGVLVKLEDVLQKSVDLINYTQISSTKNEDIQGDFRDQVRSQVKWIYEL